MHSASPSYSRPPVIPGSSLRGRAMERAAQRERALAQTRLPGYRAARLTRAYTTEEVAQGKGMSAQRLQQIAAKGVEHTPILVRHKMDMPPAGRALGADFDPASEFFHLRTVLNLGDGSSGDYVAREQEEGKLLYMSAKFTVPEPNDPRPECFESQLIEASFVDEPHEPHAQILVAHSTTDSQQPTRVLNLCARIVSKAEKMSSTPTTPAAAEQSVATDKDTQGSAPAKKPTFGGLSADEIRTLIEANKKLEAEKAAWTEKQALLDMFQERYAAGIKPKLDAIYEAVKRDSTMGEEECAMVCGFVEEAAVDHRTAPVVSYIHNLVTTNSKFAAEQAKLAEQQEASQASASELSEALRAMQQSSSSFSAGMTPAQARQLAGGSMPTVPTPMVAAHAAGSGAVPHRDGRPTKLSASMYDRIRRHADAFGEGSSSAKRSASADQ